jgi:hypothetical protein
MRPFEGTAVVPAPPRCAIRQQPAPAIRMATLSCRFCTHANPEGAKFCNDCGAPLHLRPCPQCEAITDASEAHCHQCGASLVVTDGSAVSAPDSAIAAARRDRGEAGDLGATGDRGEDGDRGEAGNRVVEADRGETGPHIPESGEARPHIPESLAACLDAADSRKDRGRDDVLHYLGRTDADDATPRASGSARAEPVRRIGSPRRSPVVRAAIVIALAVVGAGGFYAYLQGAPALRSLADLVAFATGADDEAVSKPASPAGASTASTPGAVTSPAATPPAPIAPAATSPVVRSPARKDIVRDARPAAVAPNDSGTAAAAVAAVPGAGRAGAAPSIGAAATGTSAPPNTNSAAAENGARARKAANPTAPAPRRARDEQPPAPPQHSESSVGSARDAIETRRLIARELGRFLPPDTNGRTGESSPASN